VNKGKSFYLLVVRTGRRYPLVNSNSIASGIA
jgi:hypothetical protein